MAEAFEGWAILELMGHRRLAGYVQEVELAGAAFLRLDVPASESAEGSHAAATQFYAPASVYCLTPCSQEIAHEIADNARPRPVQEWEFPRRPELVAGGRERDEPDDENELF